MEIVKFYIGYANENMSVLQRYKLKFKAAF